MATLATRPSPAISEDAESSGRVVSLPRQLGIGLALMACYFAVSLLASPDAHWLTDVGGKSATVASMVDRGDWSTDLGYWAEATDPEGRLHPFIHTQQMANGWWVNTTSVPLVFAARPLWQLGGPQLALLIPMFFAAVAALAAGAIERRLVGGDGLRSTLVLGLSTPVALYALDLWEHSIALAAMLIAIACVLAAIDDDDRGELSRLGALVIAGVAFGAAAVMRQEAMVYGFVAGVVTVGWTLRHQPNRVVGRAVALATPTVAVLVANELFERWYYGGSLRGARSGSVAGQVASEWSDRLQAAAVTFAAPIPAFDATSYLFASMLVVGLIWLGWAAFSGTDLRLPVVVVGLVAMVVALRWLTVGPTFVPGMAASTPLAMLGIVAGIRRRRAVLLALAVGPMPLVFLTQYLGGTLPQWGGRYLLLSGALLTILACAEMPKVHADVFRGVALAGLCVTSLGAYWYSVRTTSLAGTWEQIESVAGDDVVVWYDPVFARESGAQLVGSRWLSTYGSREYDAIDGDLLDLGVDRFVWLSPLDEAGRDFGGYVIVDERGRLDGILGLHATVYEREPDTSPDP